MSFKKIVGSISDKLKVSGGAIIEAIKQNTQYINAELKTLKPAEDAINTLKIYAETAIPSLKTTVNNLANKLITIEKAREQKANQFKEKIIGFLDKIVEEENTLNKNLKETEDARKNLIKSENKLAKVEAKPAEKQNPEQINQARAALRQAEGRFRELEAETKTAEATFNRKRAEIIQLIIKNIIDINKTFYDKALKLIGAQRAETISP